MEQDLAHEGTGYVKLWDNVWDKMGLILNILEKIVGYYDNKIGHIMVNVLNMI